MATLGPGVRVWIGWTPDKLVGHRARHLRLSLGTVINGPFPPGTLFNLIDGMPCPNSHTMWRVRSDHGPVLVASEDLLFPVEDGEDAVPREIAREEPRTCV